jgi:hypothetical protein
MSNKDDTTRLIDIQEFIVVDIEIKESVYQKPCFN